MEDLSGLVGNAGLWATGQGGGRTGDNSAAMTAPGGPPAQDGDGPPEVTVTEAGGRRLDRGEQ
jgi:hypothetical protein